jgi:hypothetical protein
VTPASTGKVEYRFRLSNTPKVHALLEMDASRWQQAGQGFTLQMGHLEDQSEGSTAGMAGER